jgi:hypothetical protein
MAKTEIVRCPTCNGTGFASWGLLGRTCSACGGKGTILQDQPDPAPAYHTPDFYRSATATHTKTCPCCTGHGRVSAHYLPKHIRIRQTTIRIHCPNCYGKGFVFFLGLKFYPPIAILTPRHRIPKTPRRKTRLDSHLQKVPDRLRRAPAARVRHPKNWNYLLGPRWSAERW